MAKTIVFSTSSEKKAQMIPRQKGNHWEIWSPAKINLTLEVLGKRPDGYHELRTLMTQISLRDTLLLAKNKNGDSIEITVDDRRSRSKDDPLDPIPTDGRNLIAKALVRLQEESGVSQGAHVHLTKRIPSQAGLGGGSSNAAAALLAANQLWNLGWSKNDLMMIAAEIGSDISFFLSPSPSVCEGTGNSIPPMGGGAVPIANFVVIRPPIGLSTPPVFGRYKLSDDRHLTPKQFLHALTRTNCLHRLGLLLRNDLQQPASQLTAWIGRLEAVFRRLDVVAHQMSGSGTAYFGICRNGNQAKRISGWLRHQRLGDVFLVRSIKTPS